MGTRGDARPPVLPSAFYSKTDLRAVRSAQGPGAPGGRALPGSGFCILHSAFYILPSSFEEVAGGVVLDDEAVGAGGPGDAAAASAVAGAERAGRAAGGVHCAAVGDGAIDQINETS